ncbi:unconventional myosin-XVIIIb isoform X2 [Mauremys reevesii]|uniref:unconventional myosin-XVIIIb isoform X2 n=1 Tax=Mauremys reevesii TaxID=260615 RepID=UPI00193EC7D2|nr:unconventional myosin-XVIIIb isoform X2 [Mauremys reevesii]
MAISSRLALWEQKIREEDQSPPPSSPPPLFSVIPGGFIKQLVRETEKESKVAKRKEKDTLNSKEDPPGKPDDNHVQQFVIKDENILEVEREMASEGQLLQNGLNGEQHQGEMAAEVAPRKPLPFKRVVKRSNIMKATSPAPEKAAATPKPGETIPPDESKVAKPPCPEQSSKEQSKGENAPAGAPTTGKDFQRHCEDPAKKGHSPRRKSSESSGKEKVVTKKQREPQIKAEIKKRQGEIKEKPGEIKEEPVEIKEEQGEIKEKPVEIKEEQGELKKKPGEIKEEPVENKKEPVEIKESGESTDSDKVHDDVWYETEKVWLVQKDGFTLATVLKPDVGTPELPGGRVRIRLEADNTVTEVDEEDVHRTNPSKLDYTEDLAALLSLNESSVINTLQHRYQSQLCHTYAGPTLIALKPSWATTNYSGKVFKGKRDNMPPHICSVAQRAYWSLLMHRQDQAIVPLGRSGAGKTTCCQSALEYLVGAARSVDNRVSVEKIQAMFTILKAFGTVTTCHNGASTRFSMVMSLDFNATGQITAAHLQTMLLERVRVAQQPEGESNFSVFSQMLAGLDMAHRTMLHLHQMAQSNSFGIGPCLKTEEKQKASVAFAQLQAAMETLRITVEEQTAIWRVLAGIYHLGAAGACKVGRKQFMKFEWANNAADVLGCDFEELTTAVFKHHLKQIIEQVTSGTSRLSKDEERNAGPKMTGVECVEGMAAGLYEELFAAVVSLINRSFSSSHLSMASIMVVDTPGFHNPRHQKKERAATFEELCHNYVHEQLQALFYKRTFMSELERYREENVEVPFDLPELSPMATVSVIDQNSSQVPPGGQAEEPKGLLWILDEEVLIPGSSDSEVLNRLCSYFAKKGTESEEEGFLRKCEQMLQFEIFHQLGKDPVRYDLTGWMNKAKLNLSAQNSIQVLQQSKIDALKKLFLPRSKMPLICRSVAGLEGNSQQALQRTGCVRKTFTSSLAAVKKKSVCAQIKLQMDALTNLVKRSQIHFVHCLVPRVGADGAEGKPSQPGITGEVELTLDVPTLRVQLSGAQLLDALRLYRIGYVDRMVLTQFRRRFQVLAQPVMKKYTSAYEIPDENKAIEELFQVLDLEKKSVAVGHSQVFLKPGVVSRLEKQREKLISQNMILLQAACKGFLSRQKFKRLKIQRLAIRCIQKNLAVFHVVKDWPWWQLMSCVRPLLSVNIVEDQLRVKDEELAALRRKLEKSEQSRSELRQNTELLESKILDLTTELSDERFKGEAACQVLDGERAERLRGLREIKELQSKYDQVQKKLESVEKQLEKAQQQIQLREIGISGAAGDEEWQMRFDCAQTEITFLRKRLAQLEERLESDLNCRKELEQKLGEVQSTYEGAKKVAQQMKRKCKHLACDLEDTRVLMESLQSRNHELEKKQKKFDMQLAQALGESVFEKSLREKVTQENTTIRWELGKLQQRLEQKDLETSNLNQRIAVLATRVQELTSPEAWDEDTVATLRKKLWELESSAAEQQKELSRHANAVEQLEQLHMRLEMEIERMKQMHQKELEDKEEELEDVRQSCQRRLRQLEMQLEQEFEEKQMVLHEKQDLEGLIGTLCEQIGHRDFDVEKRLRRDLKRTHALLADVQLLLVTTGEPSPSVSKEELEKVCSQWEESKAQCAEAQSSQKALALELENLHVELETISRNKNLVDEHLYQLQHEKADLLKRIDEDQEDLNELMTKHKALIAQSAVDITQIRELQTQLEDVKKEKQSLQEKLQAAQARIVYVEQSMVERSIVSRQEALICDLENKLGFQSVQIKRFEMLVLRLRDSVIKMGEELEKAAESEAREKENTKYYQMRMEEMKADMNELVQRELEASCRRMVLEKQVDELFAVRQTLQADLETSIRRIADLQVALEEVQSSDESDTESVQTALESACLRRDMDNQSSLGSTLSLEPEESIKSWMGSSVGWSSPSGPSVAGSLSRQSLGSRSTPSLRMNKEIKDQEMNQPASALSAWRGENGRTMGETDFGKDVSHLAGAQRWELGRIADKEIDSQKKAMDKLGAISPSVMRRRSSPTAEETFPSSSSALSEYVEELRRKRATEKEQRTLGLEDTSPLPIYQTTGASSLRRCRTFKEDDEFPIKFGVNESTESEGVPAGASLVRSSSLKCISSENTEPARSPALKRISKFGSCDSLLQNIDNSSLKLSSPAVGADTFNTSRLKPWRSYLEPSLDDTASADLGKDSLVFQSKKFSDVMAEGKESDPFTWKIPTLNYERRTNVDFDYFLPAIRKSQSTSSLSRSVKDRREGQRPMSVHFEDQDMADSTFLSEIKTISKAKEDAGNLSDSSSSSGSIVSFKSADSVKSRPKIQRPEGEGCAGKLIIEGAKDERRWEAEGKEDDVNSIMMKYLGKD